MSIGLVSGALSYLLRGEGVDPARAASIVALLTLPHTIYFFWGPITDFLCAAAPGSWWLPRLPRLPCWLHFTSLASRQLGRGAHLS